MNARASAWRRAAALPVRFYRRFLSPLKPPTCRFQPTCSAYAEEALLLHGPFRGGWLACTRILRCQPLCRGGFDPVPGSELERAARACAPGADVDTAGSPTGAETPAPRPPAR